jgi:hypothetical protein
VCATFSRGGAAQGQKREHALLSLSHSQNVYNIKGVNKNNERESRRRCADDNENIAIFSHADELQRAPRYAIICGRGVQECNYKNAGAVRNIYILM